MPLTISRSTGRRAIALAAALAVLNACAPVRETYRQPAIELPERWTGVVDANAAWPDRQWWSAFRSSELDTLIADAQSGNHDLRAALARVEQARAAVRIVDASLAPKVTVEADVQRTKSSGSAAANRVTLAPQVSYEVDLWGRRGLEAEASLAKLQSSQFAREVLRLALTADVAAVYFQLLSLNDRIGVAEANLALAEDLLKLLEAQKAAGRTSALEIERQRSLVASSAAAIPALRYQRQQARGALAVLLGRNPAGAPDPRGSLRQLAAPIPGAGLPSQLLERRPDIRRAEADLVAAHADVGAARAALFPRVDLTARGGWQSTGVSTLFDPGKTFFSLGIGMVGTLFDGGQLDAEVDLARARRTELVENYLQAIISAFRNVEDALAGLDQLSIQEQLQEQAASAAREAYRLAELRYKAGAADYATVLDAQRTLLAAEAVVDQSRFARYSTLIDLYRALGGGWEGQAEGRPTPGRTVGASGLAEQRGLPSQE